MDKEIESKIRKMLFKQEKNIASQIVTGRSKSQEELDLEWKSHCYLTAGLNRLRKILQKHKELTGFDLDTIIIDGKIWKKVPDYNYDQEKAIKDFILKEQEKHNKKLLKAVEDAIYNYEDNYEDD